MSYKKLYNTPEYTPVEISTDAEMAAVLIDDNIGRVYKFVGTTGTYTNGDLYEVSTVPDYLCLTANNSGSTVKLTIYNNAPWTGEYSTDASTWSSYTSEQVITLTNVGDKVYFRGNITGDFGPTTTTNQYLQFVMTGSIAASGNCNSIYVSSGFENLTTLVYQYCFAYLFSGCSVLTSAPKIPATTLSLGCYEQMFLECGFTTAPSLPATTLAMSCYSHMFDSCANLTTPPALPATALVQRCYQSMFFLCTSLQVYASSGSGHTKLWRIPTSGSASLATEQSNVFVATTGDYSEAYSVDFSYTTNFYTQNTPV